MSKRVKAISQFPVQCTGNREDERRYECGDSKLALGRSDEESKTDL
jgi:hypothetical protein